MKTASWLYLLARAIRYIILTRRRGDQDIVLDRTGTYRTLTDVSQDLSEKDRQDTPFRRG